MPEKRRQQDTALTKEVTSHAKSRLVMALATSSLFVSVTILAEGLVPAQGIVLCKTVTLAIATLLFAKTSRRMSLTPEISMANVNEHAQETALNLAIGVVYFCAITWCGNELLRSLIGATNTPMTGIGVVLVHEIVTIVAIAIVYYLVIDFAINCLTEIVACRDVYRDDRIIKKALSEIRSTTQIDEDAIVTEPVTTTVA